ncbi:MAG TPA: hypothetical protein VFI65_00005, partial [Streptosporangiaceae bacterium]|nr:hypothetical protein [Streptosporangiaceae bacterium]
MLDNLILADSLRAWADKIQDINLIAVTATVADLLRRADRRDCAVVLLDASLRVEPDPAVNARQLLDAGHRVLVIDGSSELEAVARTLATGAHGYLTRDHGLAALGLTVRAIAFGGSAWSLGPTAAAEPDGHPVRPQ